MMMMIVMMNATSVPGANGDSEIQQEIHSTEPRNTECPTPLPDRYTVPSLLDIQNKRREKRVSERRRSIQDTNRESPNDDDDDTTWESPRRYITPAGSDTIAPVVATPRKLMTSPNPYQSLQEQEETDLDRYGNPGLA